MECAVHEYDIGNLTRGSQNKNKESRVFQGGLVGYSRWSIKTLVFFMPAFCKQQSGKLFQGSQK
jgi:hypothetical protein